MQFTQNPIGSDSQLDLSDNAIAFDYAMNSPAALWTDRFGKQHKTVQQALKDVGFKPAGFDFVSGGTLGIGDRDKCVFYPTDGYWYSWSGTLPYVVPANSSPTPGGKKGWGVILKSNQIIAREALRRTYLEVGLNLVPGSFEEGGTLNALTDVILEEKTGKCYSWSGSFPKVVTRGTLPSSTVEFVDKSSYCFMRGLDPILFGADPSGTRDSTASIHLADTMAVLLKTSLVFLAGTYLVSGLNLKAKTVKADSGCTVILQYFGGGNSNTVLKGDGVDNQTFEGLIVDGGCSPDPAVWNSTTFDAFTGAAGIEISNSKNPVIKNCHARNTQRRGFRFVTCVNPTWKDCTQKRARGTFGDGFIAQDCVGTLRENCHAEDYTRIGHVDDTFGSNPKTSYNIRYLNVTAKNGHNASTLHGGGEFNAGVWCENVGSVSLVNVDVKDNTHRGVNLCSGVKNNGYIAPTAIYELINVNSDNSILGICTYSLVGLPVTVVKTNCTAINAARPFEDVARYGEDSFSSVNCHARYDMVKGGVNSRGFTFAAINSEMMSKPMFTYAHCSVARDNENLATLINTTSSSAAGDIGADPSTIKPVRIFINSVKTLTDTPIYFRLNTASDHVVTLDNADFYIYLAALPGGSLTVGSNCIVRSLILTDQQLYSLRIIGARIRGQITVTSEIVELLSVSVDIDNTEYIWAKTNKTGKYPAVIVSNSIFKKNIELNGAALRLGFGSVSFTAILTDNKIYNKGGVTTSPFLRYAAGTVRVWNGVLLDNTITNITQLDSGGSEETTVAGVTKIALH